VIVIGHVILCLMHVAKVCVDIISRDGIPYNKPKAKISNHPSSSSSVTVTFDAVLYKSTFFFLLVCRYVMVETRSGSSSTNPLIEGREKGETSSMPN
jgi:hypothetical protein